MVQAKGVACEPVLAWQLVSSSCSVRHTASTTSHIPPLDSCCACTCLHASRRSGCCAHGSTRFFPQRACGWPASLTLPCARWVCLWGVAVGCKEGTCALPLSCQECMACASASAFTPGCLRMQGYPLLLACDAIAPGCVRWGRAFTPPFSGKRAPFKLM